MTGLEIVVIGLGVLIAFGLGIMIGHTIGETNGYNDGWEAGRAFGASYPNLRPRPKVVGGYQPTGNSEPLGSPPNEGGSGRK